MRVAKLSNHPNTKYYPIFHFDLFVLDDNEKSKHTSEDPYTPVLVALEMAKSKSAQTTIKLVSTALTGYSRHISIVRGAPLVTQFRYDPIAKRHVIFEEAKKRKVAERKPLNWSRMSA